MHSSTQAFGAGHDHVDVPRFGAQRCSFPSLAQACSVGEDQHSHNLAGPDYFRRSKNASLD
eukprot:1159134-Pelagomonas_calceolata.AAC.16